MYKKTKNPMNSKYIVIPVLIGALLGSCKEEFLDLQPISSATTNNFYRNAHDIRNAVNGAYASLPTLFTASPIPSASKGLI